MRFASFFSDAYNFRHHQLVNLFLLSSYERSLTTHIKEKSGEKISLFSSSISFTWKSSILIFLLASRDFLNLSSFLIVSFLLFWKTASNSWEQKKHITFNREDVENIRNENFPNFPIHNESDVKSTSSQNNRKNSEKTRKRSEKLSEISNTNWLEWKISKFQIELKLNPWGSEWVARRR